MAADLKSLAVMTAGGVLGVYLCRKNDILTGPLNTLDTVPSIIGLPEMGLGTGKDNLPNSAYIVPAALAVAAYFYL